MKAPYSLMPVLPALLGLVSGILIDGIGASIWLGVALVIVFSIFYYCKWHYVSFVALFTALGVFLSAAHRSLMLPKELTGQKIEISATIQSAKSREASSTYILAVDSIYGQECRPFKVKMDIFTAREAYTVGSKVYMTAKIDTLDSKPDLPYETDYNKYLRTEGINYSATPAADGIHRVEEPEGVNGLVNRCRDAMFNGIVMAPISDSTSSFLVAAILGDRELLSQDVYDRYRAVGTAHILALSGLHVGIIVSLLSIVLIPIGGTKRGKLARSVLTIVTIWCYALLVGFTPSIVRAAVMVTVFILARLIQNGYSAFNALALSVIIILCINPLWLYSTGFQMSVSAVFTILLFSDVVPLKLKRMPLLYYALNIIVIPIVAMLGTGIVTAYYFSFFPGMFLFGNIVTGLILPWLLSSGVILMMFTMGGIKIIWLGACVDSLYELMDSAVAYLAEFSLFSCDGIHFSAWIMVPYFAALMMLAYSIRNRKLYPWIITALLAVMVPVTHLLTKERVPDVELYMTTKGYESKIIYRLGDEAMIWTDAEPPMPVEDYNREYARFLAARGLREGFKLVKADSGMIEFCGKIIALAVDDSLYRPSQHIHYALVGKKFSGTVAAIIAAMHPDTLLLGCNIHPLRRKRLIRECADTVPYVDLRITAFSIK